MAAGDKVTFSFTGVGANVATTRQRLQSCEGSYFSALLASGHFHPGADGTFRLEQVRDRAFDALWTYMTTGQLDYRVYSASERKSIGVTFDRFLVPLPPGCFDFQGRVVGRFSTADNTKQCRGLAVVKDRVFVATNTSIYGCKLDGSGLDQPPCVELPVAMGRIWDISSHGVSLAVLLVRPNADMRPQKEAEICVWNTETGVIEETVLLDNTPKPVAVAISARSVYVLAETGNGYVIRRIHRGSQDSVQALSMSSRPVAMALFTCYIPMGSAAPVGGGRLYVLTERSVDVLGYDLVRLTRWDGLAESPGQAILTTYCGDVWVAREGRGSIYTADGVLKYDFPMAAKTTTVWALNATDDLLLVGHKRTSVDAIVCLD